MAIALPSTYIDFDPPNQILRPPTNSIQTPPTVLEMPDGITWELTDGAVSYKDLNGHSVVRTLGGQIVSDSFNSNLAIPELTYYAVCSGSAYTTMAQNSDVCTWQIAEWSEDPTKLVAFIGEGPSGDTDVGWAKGRIVVLAWTFSINDGVTNFYINGVPAYSYPLPSFSLIPEAPTVLPEGDIYRAFILPEVQTGGEIASLSAALLYDYTSISGQIAWDPPEYDGDSPVSSYVIRLMDATGVTEFKVSAEEGRNIPITYFPPASVQVMARNQVGLSTASEIALLT